MKSELTRVMEKTGSINGVIHAAGLSGEGILQLKKRKAAEKILAPKVKGTLVLDEILKNVDLDFVILFSSIASTLGGIGLGDYCAANSFLDAFATQQRKRREIPFISVNWDMWGQVGMGLKTHMPDELKDWFERELRNGITNREGLDVFKRILGWNGSSNVIVSTRDLQVRVDLWLKRELIKEKEKALNENAAKPKYARPNISTEFAAAKTETEKKVVKIWGKLFGIEKIGRSDNFYELGGHSLLATTLLSEIRREFGTNISIRDVLDTPTVSELCQLIDQSTEEESEAVHGPN
jgi:acyl carrier protein